MTAVQVLATIPHPTIPGISVGPGSRIEIDDPVYARVLNDQGKVGIIPPPAPPGPNDPPYIADVSTVPAGTTIAVQIKVAPASAMLQLEYGLTTAYGTLQPSRAMASTQPITTIVLAGLTPGTLYHYRVIATNAGQTTRSLDLTSSTLFS